MTAWLTIDGLIANVLPMSKRSVHELTRSGRIPFTRIAGTRPCLFQTDEIRQWLDGAPLEVVDLPGGGKRVRPIERTA
jgi:excisionase family DNA binding protein